MAENRHPVSTRLHGRWLVIARLAWALITVLAVGKTYLGLPLALAERGQVCTATPEVCSQGDSLSLEQVQALESVGIKLPEFVNLAAVMEAISILVTFGTGLLIFLLRSDDWLALVVSAMLILLVSAGYETQIAEAYPSLGVPAEYIFNLGNILLFVFVSLFPSGRFSPRWMRWYMLGVIAISLIPTSAWRLSPQISNILIGLLWLSFLTLGPYSQIYRYRKTSTPVERLQTKWVVFGFAAFAVLLLAGVAIESLFPSHLGQVLIDHFYFDIIGLLIPLSLGVSVLRYRLWDIDVIIRKTLVYSVVTGLLALVYLGGVLLLQGLFARLGVGQSPAALVLSTLLIAALFNPLRRRVQEGVDRRFFRKKYDAEGVLASFTAQARDEVDIERLSAALVTAVEETMQPREISLWLKSQPTNRAEPTES